MSTYEILQYTDTYPIYELRETTTRSWFKIAPERGGIVISYGVNGHELLYLDKATFEDREANIRGGIPVLFPISSYLTGGVYEWEGQTYPMKNHGFARTLPWQVVGTDDTDGVSITLSLSSSEQTRTIYPFEFEVRYTYRLREGRLSIEQQYRNLSAAPLPIYPGFHPYFAADRKAIAYESDARRYFDVNDSGMYDYHGQLLDLDQLPESVVLQDASTPQIRFAPAEGYAIKLEYSELFRLVVLWSVAGKPFVCVEPWMGGSDELNLKRQLVYVPPGETLDAFLTMEREAQ